MCSAQVPPSGGNSLSHRTRADGDGRRRYRPEAVATVERSLLYWACASSPNAGRRWLSKQAANRAAHTRRFDFSASGRSADLIQFLGGGEPFLGRADWPGHTAVPASPRCRGAITPSSATETPQNDSVPHSRVLQDGPIRSPYTLTSLKPCDRTKTQGLVPKTARQKPWRPRDHAKRRRRLESNGYIHREIEATRDSRGRLSQWRGSLPGIRCGHRG
ncbi:hypothetical protein HPB50_027206 [Hyalomma asiaticum]|uniref:Uncharacterized protein n=1 Tax=Hyalomma asiaticum TaxID=266040 RepID=A0ACB7TPG8_HYAAI|nr:hypothetical protein HPB50_027206 [Hyalomma asiaticum]